MLVLEKEKKAASKAHARFHELLAKAKKLAKLAGGGEEAGGGKEGEQTFFRISLEHQFDGKDRQRRVRSAAE